MYLLKIKMQRQCKEISRCACYKRMVVPVARPPVVELTVSAITLTTDLITTPSAAVDTTSSRLDVSSATYSRGSFFSLPSLCSTPCLGAQGHVLHELLDVELDGEAGERRVLLRQVHVADMAAPSA